MKIIHFEILYWLFIGGFNFIRNVHIQFVEAKDVKYFTCPRSSMTEKDQRIHGVIRQAAYSVSTGRYIVHIRKIWNNSYQ